MFGAVNGSQEASKIPHKCVIISPYTGVDEDGNILPEIKSLMNKYKIKSVYRFPGYLQNFTKDFAKTVRIKYHLDKESLTTTQLMNTGISLMSGYLDKGYSVDVTIPGVLLRSSDGSDPLPISIDTKVDFRIDDLDINEPLWIERVSHTISKSGSTSKLVLKRPYALCFGIPSYKAK
jgi:hypothetical protein